MRFLPRHRLLCLALVLLVGLATVEAADASIRCLFRFLVLSYDNPATQLFDELVCESSPPSQAGVEAGHGTRLAAQYSGHLVTDSVAPHPEHPALSSGITRSPPTV